MDIKILIASPFRYYRHEVLHSNWYRSIYKLLPDPGPLYRPVFIVGCGRSGTTMMGDLLGKHPGLAYLNEMRHIWFYQPRTDIWSRKARHMGGRLELTADDITPEAAEMIPRAFAVKTRLMHGDRMVEKLPENTFRIDFINALFPDARFIHLIRNGIDAAVSIKKFADRGLWFGHKGYKWKLLAEYAAQKGATDLVDLCTDNMLKGLLEWRLSILTASEALSRLSEERVLEIRYEDILKAPLSICEKLEHFIQIQKNNAMRQYATRKIGRKTKPSAEQQDDRAIQLIAGDLLKKLGYV